MRAVAARVRAIPAVPAVAPIADEAGLDLGGGDRAQVGVDVRKAAEREREGAGPRCDGHGGDDVLETIGSAHVPE